MARVLQPRRPLPGNCIPRLPGHRVLGAGPEELRAEVYPANVGRVVTFRTKAAAIGATMAVTAIYAETKPARVTTSKPTLCSEQGYNNRLRSTLPK